MLGSRLNLLFWPSPWCSVHTYFGLGITLWALELYRVLGIKPNFAGNKVIASPSILHFSCSVLTCLCPWCLPQAGRAMEWMWALAMEQHPIV